jgi:hypothetical protein
MSSEPSENVPKVSSSETTKDVPNLRININAQQKIHKRAITKI